MDWAEPINNVSLNIIHKLRFTQIYTFHAYTFFIQTHGGNSTGQLDNRKETPINNAAISCLLNIAQSHTYIPVLKIILEDIQSIHFKCWNPGPL